MTSKHFSEEYLLELSKRQTWIVIPAAGIGSRFSEFKSKQYEEFFGQTILEFTLKKLLESKHIKVIIAVNPKDSKWRTLSGLKHPSVEIVTGGKTRRDSVFFALEHIKERVSRFDWILVHDAVRPCVKINDIKNLFDQTSSPSDIGGILASKVVGTLKRVEPCTIANENPHVSTIENLSISEAQTPQLFHFKLLYEALEKSIIEGWIITDEASAIERYLESGCPGSDNPVKIGRASCRERV